jgi:hypothetical protein
MWGKPPGLAFEAAVTEAEIFGKQGYLLLRQIIPSTFMHQLEAHAAELFEQARMKPEADLGNLGRVVDLEICRRPWSGLLNEPWLFDAFEKVGVGAMLYWSGYLIGKQAGGPATYWHQDWIFWSHPSSFVERTTHLSALIYLQDTRTDNGCLRVLPGTHARRHAVHDFLKDGHDGDAKVGRPHAGEPIFATYEDEVSLPIVAGDIIILDARTLHASFANRSRRPRLLLTLEFIAADVRQDAELASSVMTCKFTDPMATADATGLEAASRIVDFALAPKSVRATRTVPAVSNPSRSRSGRPPPRPRR